MAGTRIAAALGTTDRYQPMLKASLQHLWAPEAATEPTMALSIAMLAKTLGVAWTPPALTVPVTEAIAAPAKPGTFVTLLTGWLTGTKPTPRAVLPSAAPAAGVSIFAAAADELKFRLTGTGDYHRDSLAQLDQLATGELYQADNRTKEPSVVATAIAMWIMGRPVPAAALVNAGLCDDHMSCGALHLGVGSPLDSPLRASAAIVAITHPDPAAFPLAL